MNKMFKFNGMPYKRSGRAGGKSVSMIGMLVLLLAALLVLPSCFDDDTETVEGDYRMLTVRKLSSLTTLRCEETTTGGAYDPVGETTADDPIWTVTATAWYRYRRRRFYLRRGWRRFNQRYGR